MLHQLGETGWQRFLDRLKQLWGKSSSAELPPAAASATDVHGASTPRASVTPRHGPGAPDAGRMDRL